MAVDASGRPIVAGEIVTVRARVVSVGERGGRCVVGLQPVQPLPGAQATILVQGHEVTVEELAPRPRYGWWDLVRRMPRSPAGA